MIPITLHTSSADATRAVGAAVAPLLQPGDVLVLSGDLGAGKTQLTKGLAANFEVAEPITSPTFNILLVHEGRLPLYHFDLYRLERAEELEDLDYFGTLEADGVAVVEWGDRFAEALPRDGVSVTLEIEGDEDRRIQLMPLGPRGDDLAHAWAQAVATSSGVSLDGEGAA